MPAQRPETEELLATIERMEARYAASPLFASYRRLIERFAADLSDPRDLALSKAAALMLIRFSTEDDRGIRP